MESSDNPIEKIDETVSAYGSFVSECLSALRAYADSTPYDRAADGEVRARFNECAQRYSPSKPDRASAAYAGIIRDELRFLSRPESRDMAEVLFNMFNGRDCFDREVQFRLDLVFQIHGLSVDDRTRQAGIAQRMAENHARARRA